MKEPIHAMKRCSKDNLIHTQCGMKGELGSFFVRDRSMAGFKRVTCFHCRCVMSARKRPSKKKRLIQRDLMKTFT